MPQVLISAVEDSALNYAIKLCAALLRFGLNSEEIRLQTHRSDREFLVESNRISNEYAFDAAFGIGDIFKNLPRYIKTIWRNYECDVACLIDSPDFHLHLARQLKKNGKKVVFFILPKFWAWGGVKKIRKFHEVADALVSILPFEYEQLKMIFPRSKKIFYFGHPLVELIDVPREFELRAETLFLPGSRAGEIKRHTDLFRGSEFDCALVRKEFALLVEEKRVAKKVITDYSKRYAFFVEFERAAAKCGTVTLELALLGIPFVTFYKPDWLAGIVGKWLVDVEYFSLPNLILNREVVKEFIGGFDPLEVKRELEELDRESQLEAFEEIWGLLKLEKSVFERLAALLIDMK